MFSVKYLSCSKPAGDDSRFLTCSINYSSVSDVFVDVVPSSGSLISPLLRISYFLSCTFEIIRCGTEYSEDSSNGNGHPSV